MIAGQLRVAAPAAVEWHGALRQQLSCLAEGLKGGVILTKRGVGVAPVVVCGTVSGRQHNGAVKVLHGFLGTPEIHQGIAAIVVDAGILGRELDRLVEVGDRLIGLLQAPLSDAPVAIDARLDEFGNLRRR